MNGEIKLKELNKLFKKYFFPVAICIFFLEIINFLFGSVCYSTILFGIPCPACGITRAAKLLLTGHFRESFQMHPLLFLVIIGVVIYPLLKKLLKNYRFFINSYVIICILIFVCFYIYRLQKYYPNVEPMVYKEDNLLVKARALIDYAKQQQ